MTIGIRASNTIITVSLTGQTDFNVPFEYLARKFVMVTLLGADRKVLTLNSDYRFVSKTLISLANPTPAGYDKLEIRRVTSASERLVDFHDGSILRAHDLNISQIQTLHVAEEARDSVGADSIGIDSLFNLDARGRRIVNLAYAQAGSDAVPLGQIIERENGAYQSALRAESAADRAEAFSGSLASVKSVAELVNIRDAPVGTHVVTRAYHANSGIGGATYVLQDDDQAFNRVTNIQIGNSDVGAKLVWDGVTFNAAWSGAALDGVQDDWGRLHEALKLIGDFKITSTENVEPTIVFHIPRNFKLSKTLWCGYVNVHMQMAGTCLIDSASFIGDSVVDFDYSLINAPADVVELLERSPVNADGGWHGWNARHEVDFKNTNSSYNWSNTMPARQVNVIFDSNPASGDVLYLNGYKIMFGTDVAIGSSATATRDSFIAYVNRVFKFTAYPVGSNAEIYSANPWLCRSDTAAIRLVKWKQGIASVRVSNMWNGRIKWLRCNNFDVQLWENPCNKALGSGAYSEFGMENNEYDFGKSQNCQIVHLASPVVRDFVSLAQMPYCIDTKLLSGSVRVSGLADAAAKPHYVNVIASKYLRLRTDGALEAETVGAATGEHCLCLVLGDNENYDYDLRYMAERYKQVGRIYDVGKTGNGPVDIYIRTSFTDSDGRPTFVDSSKTRMNYADVSYIGNAVSIGIEDKFTIPVFVSGKLGTLRDMTVSGNLKLSGVKWYNRADTSESATGSTAYWDPNTGNVKCDGYTGPGVTIANETSGYCRFRIDHQGGPTASLVVRFIDSSGSTLDGNTITARGAAYDASYKGFVSTTEGKATIRCSMPPDVKAQVFIVSASALSTSTVAKALRVMQYHNEEMLHKM